MSEQQTEQKPPASMTVQQLKAELAEHDVPTGGKNKAELVALVEDVRFQQPDDAALHGETIEGEIVDEQEVEPTPDEFEREAVDAPGNTSVSQELARVEEKALELREKAVGPQQTIPAIAELNAMRVLAEQLAESRIVPSAFYKKPDDIVAAVLMGRELGIGPMQSLKDIAVIDGRPALAAHLQLAILRRGGVQIMESDVNDERAYIKARRADTGETATIEWTYAEAEKVKRKGKPLVDGDNWRNYRRDMLWARAVGRLTRRFGSDLVAGMPYTAEEVRDFDDDPYGYGTKEKPVYRQDAPERVPPRNVAEIRERIGTSLGQQEADEWIRQAVIEWARSHNAVAERWNDLNARDRDLLGQRLATITLDLEARETDTGEDLRMSTDVRQKTAAVFAKRLDGIALAGPPWRLGPDEPQFDDPPYASAAELAASSTGSTGEASGKGNEPGTAAEGKPSASDASGASSSADAFGEPVDNEDIEFPDVGDGYPG